MKKVLNGLLLLSCLLFFQQASAQVGHASKIYDACWYNNRDVFKLTCDPNTKNYHNTNVWLYIYPPAPGAPLGPFYLAGPPTPAPTSNIAWTYTFNLTLDASGNPQPNPLNQIPKQDCYDIGISHIPNSNPFDPSIVKFIGACECAQGTYPICDANFTLEMYSGATGDMTFEPVSTANSVGGYWDMGDGTIVPSQYGFSYIYANSGQYEVCHYMTMQDGSECHECYEFCIDVNLNNHRPSGTSTGNTTRRVVDQAVITSSPLSQRPTVLVTTKDASEIKIDVYDLQGKQVMDHPAFKSAGGQQKTELVTDLLAKGTYVIKVKTSSHTFALKWLNR